MTKKCWILCYQSQFQYMVFLTWYMALLGILQMIAHRIMRIPYLIYKIPIQTYKLDDLMVNLVHYNINVQVLSNEFDLVLWKIPDFSLRSWIH